MSAKFDGLVFPNTQSITIEGPITTTKNKSLLTGMCWTMLTALPSVDDFDFLTYADGTATPSHMRYKLKTFLGDGGLLSVGGTTPDGATPLFFTASTGALVPGTWYHIAGVCDYANSIGYIYVNGVLVDSGAMTGTFGATQTSNTDSPEGAIGSLTFGDSEGLNGFIEDVRLYSVHRPREIKTIYGLRGKDSIRNNLLNRFPVKDFTTGNVGSVASIAYDEQPVAAGSRNPTWSNKSVISFQKIPQSRRSG